MPSAANRRARWRGARTAVRPCEARGRTAARRTARFRRGSHDSSRDPSWPPVRRHSRHLDLDAEMAAKRGQHGYRRADRRQCDAMPMPESAPSRRAAMRIRRSASIRPPMWRRASVHCIGIAAILAIQHHPDLAVERRRCRFQAMIDSLIPRTPSSARGRDVSASASAAILPTKERGARGGPRNRSVNWASRASTALSRSAGTRCISVATAAGSGRRLRLRLRCVDLPRVARRRHRPGRAVTAGLAHGPVRPACAGFAAARGTGGIGPWVFAQAMRIAAAKRETFAGHPARRSVPEARARCNAPVLAGDGFHGGTGRVNVVSRNAPNRAAHAPGRGSAPGYARCSSPHSS